MISAAKLHSGFVWDSTPDSYWKRILKSPKWGSINLEGYTIEAPATGSPAVDWKMLGFRYVRNNAWIPIAQLSWDYPVARSMAVFVPHWAIALLLVILPAIWLPRELRRRRRLRHGLCVKCGYDLRASPTRCPECGTATGRDEAAPAR